MNSITINKREYSGDFSSIAIMEGKIIIDGKDCTPDSKNIEVTVNGDIKNLKIGACNSLQITGNVDDLVSISGDVNVAGGCGSVKTTSGDVDVQENVTGDVQTVSGDVKAHTIHGKVKTLSGDIKTYGNNR